METRKKNRKGISTIYTVVSMSALMGLCSLGVDYGHVQLAKTELRSTADSVARAAAAGVDDDASTVNTLAKQYAAANKVDGKSLLLNSNDIEIGKWTVVGNKGTFLKTGWTSSANAVHILAHMQSARGNAIPLLFGNVLGMRSCDVNAESTAMLIPDINVDQQISATSNPFLAGMPKGSTASEINPHNDVDHAGNDIDPLQSPSVVAMPVGANDTLNFDSIQGTARHDPNLSYAQPDGDLQDIGHNNLTTNDQNSYNSFRYNQNGMADVVAPINALVGVFLSDESPNLSAVPAIDQVKCPDDFTTAAARNRTSYQPALKQIFFIGDGQTDSGAKQNFIAPPGATRLYLATWDFYEWSNNAGSREVKVYRPGRIVTVQ